MSTITVNVTQEDIDNGVRKDCNRCMVALALSRALGGVAVQAGGFWATCPPVNTLKPGNTYRRYGYPLKVIELVDLFDDGRKVEPFDFKAQVTESVW